MRQDNPNHSPAYKIFHYNFEVTIPTIYLYSPEYLKTFGLSSSGDKRVDEGQVMAPTRAHLTIAAMAEYHDEGASIGLINPEDSARIYTYISQHLRDWKDSVSRDINRRNAPTEDLRKLENFAKEVYKSARHFIQEEPTNSSLFNKLNEMGRRRPTLRGESVKRPKVELPEKHENLIDDLIVEHSKRNRRGGFRR